MECHEIKINIRSSGLRQLEAQTFLGLTNVPNSI